ncbi:LOW QUALITY PROTEIN: F-box/WD repeat-containing protein 10 [Mastacembelus armatus]|uniref:LOW QUALITY PROTEIN: F-box/WD repeat-containing protein 10 n=1 Tax=Mastacembelus armatus TaxID=205130 RepID=UPI000E45DC57|nr:LOW QUALITY PROTEIN: CMT1A duplicated region transcript 1 protein [Mastacembelus armatus]
MLVDSVQRGKKTLLPGNNIANKKRQTTKSIEMKSGEFSKSESKCEGCVYSCGMCPSCVFAPKPAGCSQCPWKVSDEFRRKFIVDLLLRCRNVHLLENIQRVLGVTSWTWFTYARSRGPTSPQDCRCRRAYQALKGKPSGIDMNEIWDWFGSSPDGIKWRYLCSLFLLCDTELLRMVSNLTSVLLVRQKRRFLQFDLSSTRNINQRDVDNDEDSEDPALMVVPGSLKSMSGVSRYRDFIGRLPVDLSTRILGLLDEHTLRHCQKVSQYWQHLAKQTLEEIKFRRNFQDETNAVVKRFRTINVVSSTYANILEVPVPTNDDENVDIHPGVKKGMPFESAYAKIKTKTVQMEERNVYCGAYFIKVLLNKEDPYRVVDYRGGSLMATGSKDRVVHLFYVASETTVASVMKGHVASVRAVLLYEDRNLVITASCDASIRCWNLKTDRCEMALYGHTGTINCLDAHAERLVSGAKDCIVKVWNLDTGKHFGDFNFKHPGSIQCVKISTTKVYSSCDRGLVKVWDMETASLDRLINAHRCPVRCLFFNEWHLLSGDLNGQVMAWSINYQDKEHLMTFNHPKEVKSLILVYLRVVTGCADGKIRIFNFLNGDCLRYITAEAEEGRILSLHFNEDSILVNTTTSVKLYQFAKVFWDYKDSAEGGQGHVLAQNGFVSEKSAASLRQLSFNAAGAGDMVHVSSSSQKMCDCDFRKSQRAELHYHTPFLTTSTKSQAQVRERCETAKHSVILSEKATYERMKKRGLHHPLTRDSIFLRISAIQRAQCMDEVSINMEYNARLRDSWDPHTQEPLYSDLQSSKQSLQTQRCSLCHTKDGLPRRAKTCVPVLKSTTSQSINTLKDRDITTAPDTTRKHHPCFLSNKAQPHSAHTHLANKRCGVLTTCAKDRANPESCMKTRSSLPRINPCEPIRRAGRIQTAHSDPAERNVQVRRELLQSCERKLSKRDSVAL